MPSAQSLWSTSRPAAVTGSLTATFGAHAASLLPISYMPSRSPARVGSTCAQTYPDVPDDLSKIGRSRRIRDDDPHERLRFFPRRPRIPHCPAYGILPTAAVCLQGLGDEDRVGRDTDRTPRQRLVDLR